MRGLVLSLFPGLDLLGRAFEATGWCVVQGPDLVFGRDIRGWTCPPGRFDGVIGGPPCQAFSSLANLVRARGYEPKYGNMMPEFERVTAEAAPAWWLCENVEAAPVPAVLGYLSEAFVLSPRWLGDPQSRRRRFTVGGRTLPSVLRRIPVATLEPVEFERAVIRDARDGPATGVGRRKMQERRRRDLSADLRRKTIAEMCAIQGWPELAEIDAINSKTKRATWTAEGARQAIGNGVPRIMGEAIARAIAEWQDEMSDA
jgi:DNA (cytosine-5)-methyltransferase 1